MNYFRQILKKSIILLLIAGISGSHSLFAEAQEMLAPESGFQTGVIRLRFYSELIRNAILPGAKITRSNNNDFYSYELPSGKPGKIPILSYRNDLSLVHKFHNNYARDILKLLFEVNDNIVESITGKINNIENLPESFLKIFPDEKNNFENDPEKFCLAFLAKAYELLFFERIKVGHLLSKEEQQFLREFKKERLWFGAYYIYETVISDPYRHEFYVAEKFELARLKRMLEVHKQVFPEITANMGDTSEVYPMIPPEAEKAALLTIQTINEWFEKLYSFRKLDPGDLNKLLELVDYYLPILPESRRREFFDIFMEIIKYELGSGGHLIFVEAKSRLLNQICKEDIKYFTGLMEFILEQKHKPRFWSMYPMSFSYLERLIELDPLLVESSVMAPFFEIMNSDNEFLVTHESVYMVGVIIEAAPQKITKKMLERCFDSGLSFLSPSSWACMKLFKKSMEFRSDLVVSMEYYDKLIDSCLERLCNVVVPENKAYSENLISVMKYDKARKQEVFRAVCALLKHERPYYRQGSADALVYIFEEFPELIDNEVVNSLLENAFDENIFIANSAAITLQSVARLRPEFLNYAVMRKIYYRIDEKNEDAFLQKNLALIMGEYCRNPEADIAERFPSLTRIRGLIRGVKGISGIAWNDLVGSEKKSEAGCVAMARTGASIAYLLRKTILLNKPDFDMPGSIRRFFTRQALQYFPDTNMEVREAAFNALFEIGAEDFDLYDEETINLIFKSSYAYVRAIPKIIGMIADKKPEIIPRFVLTNLLQISLYHPEMRQALISLYSNRPEWRDDITNGILSKLISGNGCLNFDAVIMFREIVKEFPQAASPEVISVMEKMIFDFETVDRVEVIGFFENLVENTRDITGLFDLINRLLLLEGRDFDTLKAKIAFRVKYQEGVRNKYLRKNFHLFPKKDLTRKKEGFLLKSMFFLSELKGKNPIMFFLTKFFGSMNSEEKKSAILNSGAAFGDINEEIWCFKQFLSFNDHLKGYYENRYLLKLRYPKNQLSEDQADIIEDYVYILNNTSLSFQIELIPSRIMDQDNKTVLFQAEWYSEKDLVVPLRKSDISVNLSASEIKYYPLRLVALLNLTVCAVSFPDTRRHPQNKMKDYNYEYLVKYLNNNYRMLTGESRNFFTLSRIKSDNGLLSHIYLSLPPVESFEFSTDPNYSRAVRAILLNA